MISERMRKNISRGTCGNRRRPTPCHHIPPSRGKESEREGGRNERQCEQSVSHTHATGIPQRKYVTWEREEEESMNRWAEWDELLNHSRIGILPLPFGDFPPIAIELLTIAVSGGRRGPTYIFRPQSHGWNGRLDRAVGGTLFGHLDDHFVLVRVPDGDHDGVNSGAQGGDQHSMLCRGYRVENTSRWEDHSRISTLHYTMHYCMWGCQLITRRTACRVRWPHQRTLQYWRRHAAVCLSRLRKGTPRVPYRGWTTRTRSACKSTPSTCESCNRHRRIKRVSLPHYQPISARECPKCRLLSRSSRGVGTTSDSPRHRGDRRIGSFEAVQNQSL